MMSESEAPKTIRVKAVQRDCRNCVIRPYAERVGWVCASCAGLVVDEEDNLFVSTTVVGQNWKKVDTERLSKPPKVLLVQ